MPKGWSVGVGLQGYGHHGGNEEEITTLNNLLASPLIVFEFVSPRMTPSLQAGLDDRPSMNQNAMPCWRQEQANCIRARLTDDL
jgi:hypothetical protein